MTIIIGEASKPVLDAFAKIKIITQEISPSSRFSGMVEEIEEKNIVKTTPLGVLGSPSISASNKVIQHLDRLTRWFSSIISMVCLQMSVVGLKTNINITESILSHL